MSNVHNYEELLEAFFNEYAVEQYDRDRVLALLQKVEIEASFKYLVKGHEAGKGEYELLREQLLIDLNQLDVAALRNQTGEQ